MEIRIRETGMELKGKRWGEIPAELQEKLLCGCNPVDGITGSDSKGGPCIVDLSDGIHSVSGEYVVGAYEDEDDIIINDEAIIYSTID